MNTDNNAPNWTFPGPRPEPAGESRAVNGISNGKLINPPQGNGINGITTSGHSIASPMSREGSLPQQHTVQTEREASEVRSTFLGQLKLDSSREPSSSSEDELMEGESAWTMPIKKPNLLATGLCYDIRMRYHCELDPPKHRLDFHPEDPRRIYHIYRELCQAGLCKDPMFNVPLIDNPLVRILARSATAPEICLVHTPEHYKFVEHTESKMLLR